MDVSTAKKVPKPWGYEVWIAENTKYAGKILAINKGTKTSLHYHKVKEETMYVLEGLMKVTDKEGKTLQVHVGEAITLKAGECHCLEAIDELKILEVSTPELDDVVRVKDDHGRI